MRRRKHPSLLWIAALVAVLGAGSMRGWEQVNDRDWFGYRNLGIRLYGNSITFSLEQDGSFDITDGSDLTAIRNAFSTINAITTSDATVAEGATFYAPTIDSEAGYSSSDEVNRIYFFNVDSDNSFGALAAAVIYYDQFTGLILGSPVWPNRGGCDIAVNDLDYTWSTATPADPNQPLPANTYDIQSVLTGEIQHCFGFEHTAVAGSFDASTGLERDGFTSGDFSRQATLFPLAAPNIQGRTLEADDIAAFSDIYPSATAATTFGQISGRVLRPDGTGVKGAHVVAVPASDPTRPVVARLSGIEADTDPGGYRLTGLTPGNYYVRIEPLPGTTNPFTEANTGFFGFDTTFSPEFYSGAAESAVDATVDSSDAATVTVVAGATAREVDVIVNPVSVGAALNFLPARLAFLGTQGGTNPPSQSFTVKNIGTDSPDWWVTGNPSWLSVSPNSGTLTAGGDTVAASVNLTGLAPGTYRAKLVAQAVGASNSAQAISVILVVTPSANTIRTVCPSGCGYTTIQGAIDAATSGDAIRVGPGRYLEHIVMKDGVKLVGAGAELSIIDAGGSGVVVMCASNALLDGFTITGGNNTTNREEPFDYGGSGIKCMQILDTTISHNVIKYNLIPDGAAKGGGLWVMHSSISILDNVFRLNTAGYFDAFASTAAGGNGGAIHVYNLRVSDPTLPTQRVTIARNRIMDNLAGSGGGIEFYGGIQTYTFVTDNLIAKNMVTTFGTLTGGGITADLGYLNYDSITNNTIVDNFHGIFGCNISGIECWSSYTGGVTNNIIWGHRYWLNPEYCGGEISGCPVVNYSTVEGGYAGTGNSSADPLFRDRPNGDYHLLSSSPAIDAGTNSAPGISTYDLTGVPRILDGNNDGPAVADMGAYEYGEPALNPVPTLSSLSPSAKPAGSTAFTLTVNGSDFVSGAVVRWDGSDRTTSFINATQVTASIPASDIATPGTAQVTVSNPVPAGGESDALTFTITTPQVSLSPASLSFGNQALGTTSAAKPVKLTNSGSAPLTISSISTSGNYAQTNNCVSPLAAGAYCTINVTFTPPPTVAGGQAGTLTIVDNATGSPHKVTLSGIGVGPVAVLSTTYLKFGNQPLGTTSAAKLVNLSNTGNAPMTITSITVSGTFALKPHNCVSPLAPRTYCTIPVTFTPPPTVAGGQAGMLTVVDNAAGSPHKVTLSGIGVGPVAVLSTTYLKFGNQPLGTTSAAKLVNLSNTGNAPMTITSITVSGTFALKPHNCVSPLAPRTYCTIPVTFTPPPTVAGGQAGTLTVVDNAAGSPHKVTLSGIGVGPVATLSATSLNFGNQLVGTTSAAKLVNLSNTGNAAMTISSITASGNFAQTNNCPSSLAGRSYCTLSVTFTPTVAGTRTGAITIVDNAAGSPQTVMLSGTGVSP